jgi:hypothetical protein
MSSGTKGFNFYEHWLGIECDSRPDHYQLLGVAPFEADEQKIQSAFESRRQRLQQIVPGEHAVQLRKLADEVVTAKRCLLTPAARLAYDEHLRYAQAQQRSKQGNNEGLTPAKPPPTNVRQPASLAAVDDELSDLELPPVAGVTSAFVPQSRTNILPAQPSPSAAIQESFQPAERPFPQRSNLPTGVPVASSRSKPLRGKQRRKSQQGFFVVLGIIGIVAAVGLVVLSNMQAEPAAQGKAVAKTSAAENHQDKTSQAAAKSDQLPQATPSMAETVPMRPVSNPPKQPPIVPQPIASEKAETSIEKSPPVRPDDWNVEFNRSLMQVRQSLAQRNIIQAKEHLAACEQLAKWDEQREPLRLHQQLVQYTRDFWQAVSDRAAKMNGGEELEQNGKLFANVVESSATRLVVKVDGRNHRYSIPGDIDAAVAVAIARRAVSDPAEQVKLIGAFYAIDKAGNFSKAEQLWKSLGDEMMPLLTLLKAEREKGKRK